MHTQNILIVDPGPTPVDSLCLVLDDLAQVRSATSEHEAMRMMEHAVPDVIVLDVGMSAARGLAWCRALKSDAQFAMVPVIVLADRNAPGIEDTCIESGAADLVAKPVDPLLLRARVRRQLRIRGFIDALASSERMDALTGLANRREFDDVMEREWRRAERGGDALSLVMVDIDHFASYNERYGRASGDRCLVTVARALGALAQRGGDLLARYDDTRFVFLLPQTPRHGAEFMAAQILVTIDELAIAHAASPDGGNLAVSIGASYHDQQSACWVAPRTNADFARSHARCSIMADLVRAADGALRAAKGDGRACGRLLDVGDLDEPGKIRSLSPARTRRWIEARAGRRERVA